MLAMETLKQGDINYIGIDSASICAYSLQTQQNESSCICNWLYDIV